MGRGSDGAVDLGGEVGASGADYAGGDWGVDSAVDLEFEQALRCAAVVGP